ncbi:MAG: PKD domain-containing protein, partial [Candidatus Natronoplasma sp.]
MRCCWAEGPTAGFEVEYPESPNGIGRWTPRTHESINFIDHSVSSKDSELDYWIWDFGDGTERTRDESTVETHSYSDPSIEPEDYTVRLTVEDKEGNTDTFEKKITVKVTPPDAQFTYSPEYPEIGEEVEFDGSGSYARDGEIEEMRWYRSEYREYEYSKIGEGESLNHAFEEGGVYNIKLEVEDEHGTVGTEIREVNVGPVAVISRHKVTGQYEWDSDDEEYEMTVELDGGESFSSAGDIVNYKWTFKEPDGSETVIKGADKETVEYTYSSEEPMNYHFPELTVTDDVGKSHTTSTRVMAYSETWYPFPDRPEWGGPIQKVSGYRLYDNEIGLLMEYEVSDDDAGKKVRGEYVNVFDNT